VAHYGTSDDNSAPSQEVGGLSPNELGICDMTGNVWEWCSDYYAGNYSSQHETNPTGPTTGVTYSFRGGGINYTISYCRAARRGAFGQNLSYHNYLGFRVVLVVNQP
jgi:formylglycine-generating enzyme required for sulfatase activity